MQGAPARQAAAGGRGVGCDAHEVVGAAVDPAGVGIAHEVLDLGHRQREHAGEIPSREGEDSGLEGVVRRKQQMRPADALGVLVGERVEIGDPDRRGAHRRRRTGDAVGGEGQVVGPILTGERREQIGAHGVGELAAGDDSPAEGVGVLRVGVGEVHELVGQLVMVLQRVDE